MAQTHDIWLRDGCAVLRRDDGSTAQLGIEGGDLLNALRSAYLEGRRAGMRHVDREVNACVGEHTRLNSSRPMKYGAGEGKPLQSTRHPTPIDTAMRALRKRDLGSWVQGDAMNVTAAVTSPGSIAKSIEKGQRTFGHHEYHEIGNWLLDTARTAYPDRGWDRETESSLSLSEDELDRFRRFNAASLEQIQITRPALEIKWELSHPNNVSEWQLKATHHIEGGGGDISFAVIGRGGMDLEHATQHLRAALEAAWHTYRKNTDK